MNESPSDLPIEPQPPYYQPRRLSILDLLLWMTVTAVLLALRKTVHDLTGHQESTPLRSAGGVLHDIFQAACVVGSGRIIYDKIRGVPGRLQPGHWFLLGFGIGAIWLLAARHGMYALGKLGFSEVGKWYFVNSALWSGLMALVAAFLIIRSRQSVIWRVVFGVFALECASWAVCLVLVFLIISDFIDIPQVYTVASTVQFAESANYVVESLLVLVAAVAMLSDLINHRSRDHLHWIGAGVAVLLTAWSVAMVILDRFFNTL